MMNTLPCKKCIVFPICRLRYNEVLKREPAVLKSKNQALIVSFLGYARFHMSKKCSLLNDYLYRDSSPIRIEGFNPFYIFSRIQNIWFNLRNQIKRIIFDEYFNRNI